MKWNLKRIYDDFNAWEVDLKKLEELTNEAKSFKGKLNDLNNFVAYFKIDEQIDKLLSKLFTYASMNFDLNQKQTEAQGYYGKIYSVYSKVIAETSFVTPEIIAIGKEKIDSFIKADKTIAERAYALDRIFRNKEHILDAKSELLMANYGEALSQFNRLYDKLAVQDNTSTKVTLSDGTELDINESNFRSYLGTLENQDDRRKVFEAVFKFYDKHKNTFAGIYDGIMQSNYAECKNRGYKSVLEMHLYSNAIPVSVYETLIKTTRENAYPIKKYYELRKKHFNLETIHTYDRFLDLAKSDKKYSYDEAKALFFESVKSIGGTFEEHAHEVLASGRVDVEIKDGKRTGAYSTGVYGVGPFILLNHSSTLDDCFTIAHEAGHSIHTMFSEESQPYATHDYVIFVAEIASTFNEQLLLDYLMSKIEDKATRIVLLQQAIDGLIGTFYRQSLFADYEYEANKLVEEGNTITNANLSEIMKKLYKDYYDIDLNDEPYKENVWGYIPHFFHSPFYVYQYATSFAASLSIYESVKNKKPHALDNYLNLLKSGGSDYPINLVKKAGVDLTTDKPFISVVNRLNELVDLLEKELN